MEQFFVIINIYGATFAKFAEKCVELHVGFRCCYLIVTIIGMCIKTVVFVRGHTDRQTDIVKLTFTFLKLFVTKTQKKNNNTVTLAK